MSNCKGCGFPNCDLEVRECRCTFHARCFPLCKSTPFQPCPGCNSNKTPKLCILPTQPAVATETKKCSRSGRWTIQEITVVDEICRLFELGMLPLPSATKLSEFLSQFLSCKPSRLTKKLRMGNLSQLYVRKQGYINDPQTAYEFTTILTAFLSFFPELQVKSENVWRESFLNLCLELRVPVVNASEFCEGLTQTKARSISIASSLKAENNSKPSSGNISDPAILSIAAAPLPVTSSVSKQQEDEYLEGLDAFLQDLDDEPSSAYVITEDSVTTEEDADSSEEGSVTGEKMTQMMHYQHLSVKNDNRRKSESKTVAKDVMSPLQKLCNLLAMYMPLHTSPDDTLGNGYTLLRLSLLRYMNGSSCNMSSNEEEVLQVVLSSYSGYCVVNGGVVGKDIARLIVQEYLMLSSQMTQKRHLFTEAENNRETKRRRTSSMLQIPTPCIIQRSVSNGDSHKDITAVELSP